MGIPLYVICDFSCFLQYFYFSVLLLSVWFLCVSARSTLGLSLCRRPYNASMYVWLSVLWGHCFFPRGSWCILCAPSKRGVSVSLSPVEFLKSYLVALQNQIIWGLLPHCHIARLKSLMQGSELSLLWNNVCAIIIFQFVNHPLSVHGIWVYHNCAHPTISFWLFPCLWMLCIFLVETDET